MTATLSRPLSVSNGGARETPKWGNGRQDPIAAVLGPRWGLTPKSAERLLSGPDSIFARAADAFREMRTQGADARLARVSRDLMAAIEGREAPPLVAAVWHQNADADAAEDVCRSDYLNDPSPDNADRYERALEKEVLKATALLDAFKRHRQEQGA